MHESLSVDGRGVDDREDDRRWMERAIELATDNVVSGVGGPFGAVIVRGGEMLAEGKNVGTMRQLMRR